MGNEIISISNNLNDDSKEHFLEKVVDVILNSSNFNVNHHLHQSSSSSGGGGATTGISSNNDQIKSCLHIIAKAKGNENKNESEYTQSRKDSVSYNGVVNSRRYKKRVS